MKTNIKILLLFLMITNGLPSQNLVIGWQNCFGGTNTDNSRELIQFNGNYYLAGSTQSNDGDVTFNHGSADAWLIKTDHMGNMLWQKTYGGTEGDGFGRVLKDGNNNLYLMGGSNSSDGDLIHDPYPGTFNYWIIKTDSIGQIIWNKILGGNQSDILWTGITTDDGGLIALGYSNSFDGEVSVNYGMYDMWMIKLNSEGETEWDFTIGNDKMNYGHAIVQTDDGGYLIGGDSFEGEGGNLNCNWYGAADAVIVKLDSKRNIEWQRCYGGSDHDGLRNITKTTDGYLLLASSQSTDGDVSGLHGEKDIWVIKIDTLGNIIWQKCFGGSSWDFAYNMFKSLDENYVIVGQTQSHDGDVTGNHSLSEHDYDLWMLKINEEGDLLWQQCFGGEGNEDMFFAAIQNNQGNYVVAGRTDWGPSYDVQCDPYDMSGDWWVFEAQDTSTRMAENIVNEHSINLYPNPAHDFVVFEIDAQNSSFDEKSIKLRITDVIGNEISCLDVKARKTALDTKNFKAGVYLYNIQSDHMYKSGKFLISR